MRRVKLIRKPDAREESPFVPRSSEAQKRRAKLEGELEFYRHRCDEEWFEALLEETGLAGKRLNPSRVRKILLQAVRKRMERE